MKELRTAIVGMGIGRANGRAILANPRGRITAICDIIPEKMDDFAKELPEPVKKYIDYKEMCQDPDIDAVMVARPTRYTSRWRWKQSKTANTSCVTKPLSDSEDSARELVEAAEATGLVNMMSLGMRFSDPVLYLGDLIQPGRTR